MKYRQGFVSNSSSASFVVPKSKLSESEISALLAYNLMVENTDGWTIYENDEYVRGSTVMDNDALDDYLESIDFDFRKMEWSDY